MMEIVATVLGIVEAAVGIVATDVADNKPTNST